jgi:hypothetical protein
MTVDDDHQRHVALASALLDAMDDARTSRTALPDAARRIAARVRSAGFDIDDTQTVHLARVATSWRWRLRHPRQWARYRYGGGIVITG